MDFIMQCRISLYNHSAERNPGLLEDHSTVVLKEWNSQKAVAEEKCLGLDIYTALGL